MTIGTSPISAAASEELLIKSEQIKFNTATIRHNKSLAFIAVERNLRNNARGVRKGLVGNMLDVQA